MPHELSFAANGEAEMFFVGDTPWHGFGQRLDRPATAAEAIAAAHLDWEVELVPVYSYDSTSNPAWSVQEPHRFVRRTDNGKNLGLRTSKYSVAQNVNCFGLFDAVIGPGRGVYHTAGALKDGRVVWILAKMGAGREVVAGDVIEPYLLLSTSHDGSLPLQMRYTYVRVICNNTFQYAIGHSDSAVVTIRHSGDLEAKAVQARRALHLSGVYFDRMMEGVDALVTAKMDSISMAAFTDSLLSVKDDAKRDRKRKGREKLMELYEAGRGQDIPGVAGTAYAAYNAATEFVDYYASVGKSGGQDVPRRQDNRLHKAWFGKGRDTKMRAWNLLHDYARKGVDAFPKAGHSVES